MCNSDLFPFGLLRIAGWFFIDVSGQPIAPIFILEDGTDTLSWNFDNKPNYVRNNREQRMSPIEEAL